MLKLSKDFDITQLINYGFVSYKANRDNTYYYACARVRSHMTLHTIVVDSSLRNVVIDDVVALHACMHKHPRYKKRAIPDLMELLVDLASRGVIVNG